MFCPQCGAHQSEELKFCKSCGANLSAVRQAVATRETDERFDWSKTWVAEMFMSGEEQLRRKREIERLEGETPEVKRYKEIKAGVITSCVGLGVAIFLYVISEGMILSGSVPPHDAEMMSRVWVAGVIPLMVGIGLLINGLFVSKRLVEAAKREQAAGAELGPGATRQALRPADTAEFIPSDFSVTEGTTKHLSGTGPKSSGRDA